MIKWANINNTIMRVLQTITNQYDNIMKPLVWSDKIAKNFINCIKYPMIIQQKDMIPQWKFCTVYNNKRCTENIGFTDVIILDFDSNDYSIDKFESEYREFFYILHTSHSYDGINQKFRVFLFLDKEYEINRLFFKANNQVFSTYNYFINKFKYIDPASFVKAQFFKIPAIKDKNAPYYYNLHNGKLFNPLEIFGFEFDLAYNNCVEIQENYLRKQEEEYRKYLDENGQVDLTKAKEFINNTIEKCAIGGRHNQVFSLACWFKKIGGSFNEFEQLMPTWADRSYHKQMMHLRNEWPRLR